MGSEGEGVASVGYCKLDCGNFTWYILLFSLFVFVHSTSEVGSMLLILRCVDPTDKALALGLIQFAIGLFGKLIDFYDQVKQTGDFDPVKGTNGT